MIAACSILVDRKHLAIGSFTSRGQSSQYALSGGCFGCTFCERTQDPQRFAFAFIPQILTANCLFHKAGSNKAVPWRSPIQTLDLIPEMWYKFYLREISKEATWMVLSGG